MDHRAIAILDIRSIAAGIAATDTMIKRAPIALLRAGTVQPGRFLVLLGGTTAATEEAWRAGLASADAFLHDDVFLPDPHQFVLAALRGDRQALAGEALGVIETEGSAALLRAADAGAKAAEVNIAELRLADGLGGNAFLLFAGGLTDVQAALDAAAARAGEQRIINSSLLPRLDADLGELLSEGTRFADSVERRPLGAELDGSQACISEK